MIVFWRQVLNCFVENSARLLSADQDISPVADIYTSLIGFIKTLRDFDDMAAQAKELTSIDNYTEEAKQVGYLNTTVDTMKALHSLKKCDRHVTSFVKIRFLSSSTP